jgi:hypothetical protein
MEFVESAGIRLQPIYSKLVTGWRRNVQVACLRTILPHASFSIDKMHPSSE